MSLRYYYVQEHHAWKQRADPAGYTERDAEAGPGREPGGLHALTSPSRQRLVNPHCSIP